MKYLKIVLGLFLAGSVSLPVQAQLQVTSASGQTPNNLVQNVLIGQGVTVTNVKFNNSTSTITVNSIGEFGNVPDRPAGDGQREQLLRRQVLGEALVQSLGPAEAALRPRARYRVGGQDNRQALRLPHRLAEAQLRRPLVGDERAELDRHPWPSKRRSEPVDSLSCVHVISFPGVRTVSGAGVLPELAR